MGWLILVAVILVFLAVILIRTAAFKPKAQGAAAPAPVQVDEKKAVSEDVYKRQVLDLSIGVTLLISPSASARK